jgi:ribosomal silencing factor RsfS
VIVNVFVPEEREYFNLEKLWLGVPQLLLDDVRNV